MNPSNASFLLEWSLVFVALQQIVWFQQNSDDGGSSELRPSFSFKSVFGIWSNSDSRDTPWSKWTGLIGPDASPIGVRSHTASSSRKQKNNTIMSFHRSGRDMVVVTRLTRQKLFHVRKDPILDLLSGCPGWRSRLVV